MKNNFQRCVCDIFMNNYSTVSRSTINRRFQCQHLRGKVSLNAIGIESHSCITLAECHLIRICRHYSLKQMKNKFKVWSGDCCGLGSVQKSNQSILMPSDTSLVTSLLFLIKCNQNVYMVQNCCGNINGVDLYHIRPFYMFNR